MRKSRITRTVAETTADLRRLGFIDKRKQHGIKSLMLRPVNRYNDDQIRALRRRLKLNRTGFAGLLNVSPSTVRKWEIGGTQPNGPSLKLLNLLDRKGVEVLL